MSRFPLLTAAVLGALTLASTACSHAEDGGRPPVLDALQGQGLEIVEEFDAGAGLRGFAGVAGHLLDTGDAAFTRMAPDSVAHCLILIGFLVMTHQH